MKQFYHTYTHYTHIRPSGTLHYWLVSCGGTVSLTNSKFCLSTIIFMANVNQAATGLRPSGNREITVAYAWIAPPGVRDRTRRSHGWPLIRKATASTICGWIHLMSERRLRTNACWAQVALPALSFSMLLFRRNAFAEFRSHAPSDKSSNA